MKSAFTLMELLVVIGIMGLMGTVSVGGYRAMQRGMEERGVMENVNTIVRAAYERAQIDRTPTAMYFWNETIRSESQDENAIVIGHAVAVRQHGRISSKSSGLLIDEFADLNLSYPTDETGDSEDEETAGGDGSGNIGGNLMYIYQLDNLNGGNLQLKRSIVRARVSAEQFPETYLQGKPADADQGKITQWGFQVENQNGVTWNVGSAYGFEFAEITLPRNYIFGTDYSKKSDDPVREAGTMVFNVGQNSGTGVTGAKISGSMTVYALAPDGSGGLKVQKVKAVEKPN